MEVVRGWMSMNKLKLNPDKTEVLLVGPISTLGSDNTSEGSCGQLGSAAGLGFAVRLTSGSWGQECLFQLLVVYQL